MFLIRLSWCEKHKCNAFVFLHSRPACCLLNIFISFTVIPKSPNRCLHTGQCFQTVNSASISLIIHSPPIQPGIVVIAFGKIKASRIESIHLPRFLLFKIYHHESEFTKKKMTRKYAAIIMLNDILHGLNGNGKFDRHSDSNQGCLENCGKRRAERKSDHVI